jgi:MFS family permease
MSESADPSAATAPHPLARAVLLVFLPFAGGYFLSYLLRSLNAVIAPQLVRDIGLSPADLGLLTSAYFLAFGAFQLPLGLLLDRFGPRRVQTGLLLVAASGILLFGLGTSKAVLMTGRALIGLGFAGGLMSSFKAITLWFPAQRWALVNGCFFAMGGLGAMAATKPIEFMLGYTDWRGICFGLCAITVSVALIILFVVPERQDRPVTVRPLGEQLRGIAQVYSDPVFWRLAPMAATSLAAGLAIQGLWAGPWLRDIANFERALVADHLFALTAALTFGFVAVGLLADLCARVGIGLVPVMGWGVLVFFLSQAALIFELAPTNPWVWMVFGALSNITALAFPLLSTHFPLALTGRANTSLNVLIFALAFALQYAIGAVIGLWPETADGGYDPAGYRAGFGAVLVLQLVGFAWFLLPGRKT